MFPSENGLSNKEVEKRLAQYGPNVLPEQAPPSNLSVFFAQLKNPLIYVLLFAGVLTVFLGHISDSLIIFLAVLLNTILGFIQEKRAGQAFIALKQFVTNTAEVIREGERVKIAVACIVPGDMVVLAQGTKIPADGVLIFTNRVYFDEAIITGESLPVAKTEKDEVFMGTTVSLGQALMRVTATGSKTKIGHIAQEIQTIDEDSPLKRQLGNLSKKLVVLILGLIVCVFSIGLIRSNDIIELFSTSIALAVSSVPEGLAVSLTVVLAIGMQRILRRKGLVRKLASAETLGGVTTICIDKTGTLTQGKMQIVDHIGDTADMAQQMLLANDRDDPIVITAYEWGQANLPEKNSLQNLIKQYPRLDSIPFSPKERFFISLHQWTDKTNMVFVNGAPDILLPWTNASKKQKEEITKKIDELTSQGRRLIGLARREVPQDKIGLTHDDAKSGLTWVGLLAFFDPVRPSVKESLQLAKQAGIKIIVITGDYSQTARYVLAEIGLPIQADEIIEGREIENLSISELSQKLKSVWLFARTTPDQKQSIVQALQKNGEVVAMMGDGVNDAPAIHQADIGIVVSEASDVARESADLVLLDSNFSTIIAAVEEGRAIFDNIRKIILYLLSDAFAEILVVMGSILLGLPLPITAIQIIWINLVSDGFPDLALTIDPKNPGIMSEQPRSTQEKLVNGWMMALVGIVSAVAGVMALLVFVITYRLTANLGLARSMTFVTLGLNSLAYVFSIRSLLVPFWKNHVFENKWLIGAVLLGFGLQVVPFLSQSTRTFFGVVELPIYNWLLAIGLSLGVFFTVEVFKFLRLKLNY